MPQVVINEERLRELLSRANDLRWRSNAGALEERIEIHSRLLDALPALLDRIAELEGDNRDLEYELHERVTGENTNREALRFQAERVHAAETELSALKAKMEKGAGKP